MAPLRLEEERDETVEGVLGERGRKLKVEMDNRNINIRGPSTRLAFLHILFPSASSSPREGSVTTRPASARIVTSAREQDVVFTPTRSLEALAA
jgi:hypothetical protein